MTKIAELTLELMGAQDSVTRMNEAGPQHQDEALALIARRNVIRGEIIAYVELLEQLVGVEADLSTPDAHAGAENLAANQLHDRVVELEVKLIEQARKAGARCDHGEDASAEWLPAFENSEIYRCGCGVLLDINDPMRAMTAEEICEAVRVEA